MNLQGCNRTAGFAFAIVQSFIPFTPFRVLTGGSAFYNPSIVYPFRVPTCDWRPTGAGLPGSLVVRFEQHQELLNARTHGEAVGYPINIWPKPRSFTWTSPHAVLLSPSFTITSPSHPYLTPAVNRYLQQIQTAQYKPLITPSINLTGSPPLLTLTITVTDIVAPLAHGVNESYTLTIPSNATTATLVAVTPWGAMRGLESLSQLVWGNPARVRAGLVISDWPMFPHRGILLDTSRNYYGVEDLLRLIGAMSANKLNVFHWHITDSQSFPLVLKSEPELVEKGSYGPDMRYSAEDVKRVVEFGLEHGVRIIPEIDMPGNQVLEIFINNTNTYILSLNRTAVYWEDVILNPGINVNPSILRPETTIMQTWNNGPENTKRLVSAGYRTIVSSSDFYYLDCGHGDFSGNNSAYDQLPGFNQTNGGSWCGPFKSWQLIYNYDITYGLTEEEARLVLGGEVALWSEQSDPRVLDSRIWPRASAMAEALWSGNRDETGMKRSADATDRLNEWVNRMVSRGVKAEPIQPLWCIRNPGMCNTYNPIF
ncbi:hypothetical protein E3N88_04448 [Mikania micrantha]|uniref:Beta-hexosaminidase n=1 Tax=Mikania micrantha TaxID=192012 RepID=A0A5N6PXA1_9ASTR|nr:hypothetical protein E3N88_04448 [Mikania micrantha]